MSYRIITHRDNNGSVHRRQYILDEEDGAVVGEVVNEDGARRLVGLANRAERDAAEKAKERTHATGDDE